MKVLTKEDRDVVRREAILEAIRVLVDAGWEQAARVLQDRFCLQKKPAEKVAGYKSQGSGV